MITRPGSTNDLRLTERQFATAMSRLGFGRFEYLRINQGELVLDPWPQMVKSLKFGSNDAAEPSPGTSDFLLKKQVAEFFEHVRRVVTGEIRCLEIRHGLPFSMEIEHTPPGEGGARG